MNKISAILGFIGVALGAFGAHALKSTLFAAGTYETWATAVHYQLFHALALLGLGLLAKRLRWPNGIAAAWTIGVVLFSGSLYALSLGGPRWLGPITPLGGLSFLTGWALLFFNAKPEAPDRQTHS